jgi:hypothetical protein
LLRSRTSLSFFPNYSGFFPNYASNYACYTHSEIIQWLGALPVDTVSWPTRRHLYLLLALCIKELAVCLEGEQSGQPSSHSLQLAGLALALLNLLSEMDARRKTRLRDESRA